MPLAGHAFLALWNDIARSREPEYDRWHTKEHVPERVAVEGFLGARRYVNRMRAAHRYFTLYEVDDLAVFEHAQYTDLVQHPTPWSASMRPDFANFLRATCATRRSQGEGIGGALAILAFARLHDVNVDALLEAPGVVACHLGERAGDGAATAREFDHVLLIEATERVLAEAALSRARVDLRLDTLPRDFGNDVYDLAFVFPGHDAAARRAHRRPHWDA